MSNAFTWYATILTCTPLDVCMFVNAKSIVGMGVYMCVTSSTKSCIRVCNGSDPEVLTVCVCARKINGVCVFVHARSMMGMGVCLPFPVSSR